MQKIGVIYNPFAGSNKHKKNRSAKLKKILAHKGIFRETHSLQELEKTAKDFCRRDIDIIAISGGDGSNHYVFTALQNVYAGNPLPHFALLRGGTMNLLETSLGMKDTPEKRLKKLIKAVEQDSYPVIAHTLLCVNNKYGYIFGNGVVANFLKEYYATGKPSFMQAAALFTKGFWSILTGKKHARNLFHPVYAEVSVEGMPLAQRKFSALMAATEKECGFGFQPFFRAREQQGKFHFLALDLEPKEVLSNLPNFRAGKKAASKSFSTDAVTNQVVIETEQPYYYTIDGEMLNSTTTIKISAGPVIKLIMI